MIPKANLIQSGNQNPIYINNEEPEIMNNNEEPEIEEPEFVKEIIQNNGQQLEEPKQETKTKYNIIDLFWLINENIFEEPKIQVHFVEISYNIDFGNLKITLFKVPDDAIDNHVLYRNSLNILISGTIYPSSAFRILNSQENDIVCMEQLITKTNELWQKQRPMVQVQKDENSIKLIIYNHNGEQFTYIFTDWQKEVFEHSLKFIYNQGFNLRGNNVIRK